jgi:hypothetical protein
MPKTMYNFDPKVRARRIKFIIKKIKELDKGSSTNAMDAKQLDKLRRELTGDSMMIRFFHDYKGYAPFPRIGTKRHQKFVDWLKVNK